MPPTIEYQDPAGRILTLTAAEAFDLAKHSLPRREQAFDLLQQVLQIEPAHRDALNLLGMIYVQSRQPQPAIECFQTALAYGNVSPAVACHLGWHFAEEGKREQAIGCLLVALASPMPQEGAARLHTYIAHALNDLECFEAAVEHFQKALEAPLPPEVRAKALNGLGHALVQVERFEEAAPCFVEALAIPDDPACIAQRQCNLGMVLGQLGQYDEEVKCYERALELVPAPLTRMNRALAALRMGDFALGWREYEYRWGKSAPQGEACRAFPEPLWDGGDISGRRILLHAEQGLGDTIQFARYVPLVIARGAAVILEVQPALKPLLAQLPGLTVLLARGETLPQFDVQCPLLSLPLAFGTTVETIPRETPYLRATEESRRAWRARLGGETRFKVGLVWAGSPTHKKDRTRSAPVECLAPLMGIRGACFYSFQVGDRSAECRRLEPLGPLSDLSPLLTDFNETAAAVEQMDVLISVDTSMAHLGGALGVETWVLLPAVADWRWMLGRADSPWYPGMRLFRQTSNADWPSVTGQVRAQLLERAAGR